MTDYRKFADNYPNTYWSTKVNRLGELALDIAKVFFFIFGVASFLIAVYLIRISL